MTADLGYSLSTVAVPACLNRVHDLLEAAWAEHPDVGLTDRTLFEIAVTEVAGNIVEHAAAGDEPLEIRVVVHVADPRLEASFEDGGPAADGDLDAAGFPDDLAESGRGLALARRAADEVAYWRDGTTNHWRIVRGRTGA
jgi:serine/threonine-protein kinase RsbW